jgi:hypothetical protein
MQLRKNRIWNHHPSCFPSPNSKVLWPDLNSSFIVPLSFRYIFMDCNLFHINAPLQFYPNVLFFWHLFSLVLNLSVIAVLYLHFVFDFVFSFSWPKTYPFCWLPSTIRLSFAWTIFPSCMLRRAPWWLVSCVRIVTTNFVMSVRPPAHPRRTTRLPLQGMFIQNIIFECFFENLTRKYKLHENMTRRTNTSQVHFWYLAELFSQREMF